ncbi:MAG: M48 family metallopeptidase [Acidobacteria bacterium]|nr:M48 family metallopeptidase [Acidobacteriota bacterium]
MTTSAPIHCIPYGKENIHFSLSYTSRKTLAISVHPDLSVTVTAPQGTALKQIKAKVRKRAAWILKQQNYFEQFMPPSLARQYLSGETHYYLGRQYRLKVEEDADDSVKLRGEWIQIRVRRKEDTQRIKALLDEWQLTRARERFQISLDKCGEKLRKYKIAQPQLRIRKMAKRWGSCTRGGIIYLNPELIKAPPHCIDYVITHELCHLKFPHHGKGFYSLMRLVMPDWEQRKKRLESIRM